MPALTREAQLKPISCSGTGALACADMVLEVRTGFAATLNGRSSNEFHASHCGQRPSQRGDSNPHAEQKYTARGLATACNVLRGCPFA
jgi:hypothetical protein